MSPAREGPESICELVEDLCQICCVAVCWCEVGKSLMQARMTVYTVLEGVSASNSIRSLTKYATCKHVTRHACSSYLAGAFDTCRKAVS